MQTEQIVLDRKQARELYRKYKAHAAYSKPIDDEIRRTYQLIAQGRVIIKALQSIIDAGLNDEGLPKLALVRADAPRCRFRVEREGRCVFYDGRISYGETTRGRAQANRYSGLDWPGIKPIGKWEHEAITPIVPINLRPKRGLENYQILWEAEWTRVVPVDPMLIRRIGKGDLWVVCGTWDLTSVEQAALAARLNG